MTTQTNPTPDALVERRVPVPMFIYKADDHEPLDAEGLRWLADQLCSEDRVHPERTMSVGWIPAQAAYEFPRLIDTLAAMQKRIERLEKALEPFARTPMHGKHGGPFVIAHAVYEDMTEGSSAPRAAYWHKDHFDRARTALGRGE